ncbi:hypothetical protein GQX74_014774 [Glossina fuscipes]|nr:hypothetical protein GQX74_014774 [Glossina fuscipes]
MRHCVHELLGNNQCKELKEFFEDLKFAYNNSLETKSTHKITSEEVSLSYAILEFVSFAASTNSLESSPRVDLNLGGNKIARVRASLFQINGVKKEPLQLPEPEGPAVSLNEKVYVPVREHPDKEKKKKILALLLLLLLSLSLKF